MRYYHEEPRLLDVLLVVVSAGLDHLVCVDDGSTDEASRRVAERFPQVQVLRLAHNQGKAAAIAYGLRHLHHEWVLLLDADLRGVQAGELARALRRAQRRPKLDMLILRRLHAPWLVRQTRGDVLLSGERLVRRRHLAAVLDERVTGFRLEVALNSYRQTQGGQVAWLLWSATNVPKHEKRGSIRSLVADASLYTDLLWYVVARAYARQFRDFARQGA